MRKVLVTTDGSKYAEKGLEHGRKIAEKFCSEVIVLNVIDDFSNAYLDDSVYLFQLSKDVLEKNAKIILQEVEHVFEGFCGSITTLVKNGDPAKVIIETIEEEEPDLVVMGSKGLTGIKKVAIGSVSNKVLNHTKVPVLIIR
ncbi:MAG: hypothetical protein K0R93_2686 [Anaerosolibacter sp.]|uniref:universal stress protein n=1 Tax=Anaerosolibacter sp. TaxID=1872527 RepID=UPI002629C63C|nr:universal stress protein [Anaerosolibacter sp.]MDF2547788.1 hypothetical protein [Anaerosolibacter sp.]